MSKHAATLDFCPEVESQKIRKQRNFPIDGAPFGPCEPEKTCSRCEKRKGWGVSLVGTYPAARSALLANWSAQQPSRRAFPAKCADSYGSLPLFLLVSVRDGRRRRSNRAASLAASTSALPG